MKIPLTILTESDRGPVVRVPRGNWEILTFNCEVEHLTVLVDGDRLLDPRLQFCGPCNVEVFIDRNGNKNKISIFARLVNDA